MNIGDVTAALTSFRSKYVVQVADSAELTREAYCLRHQVYCLERGYELGAGGLETDAFDAHASHAVVCERQNGRVVGTVRLILPVPGSRRSLPTQQLCAPGLLDGLPLATTAEVSRFALSKDRRGSDAMADSLLRLSLVQGAVQMSRDFGVTHWCAVMERSLLRLLRTTAIHFSPVGPCVEYHGLRQPAVADLGTMMARMEREQPRLWHFVTGAGEFWPSVMEYSEAA